MIPLHIVAELSSPLYLSGGWLALDALLASQIALRRGLVALDAESCVPIEIPVQREPGGRFHLCSVAFPDVAVHELQHTHRRPVIEEAQRFGDARLKRIDIATGANKAYRIPRPVQHCERIEWWCVGAADVIEDLLATVSHLGKRRAVGLGRVERWTVQECVPWGDGFPVVRDGNALRPLPADWPGLVDPQLSYMTLSYPHWDHAREELCACPERHH